MEVFCAELRLDIVLRRTGHCFMRALRQVKIADICITAITWYMYCLTDLQQISQDSSAGEVEPPVADTGPSTSQQPVPQQSEYQQLHM